MWEGGGRPTTTSVSDGGGRGGGKNRSGSTPPAHSRAYRRNRDQRPTTISMAVSASRMPLSPSHLRRMEDPFRDRYLVGSVPFGSPASWLAPGPWLCALASRRVCPFGVRPSFGNPAISPGPHQPHYALWCLHVPRPVALRPRLAAGLPFRDSHSLSARGALTLRAICVRSTGFVALALRRASTPSWGRRGRPIVWSTEGCVRSGVGGTGTFCHVAVDAVTSHRRCRTVSVPRHRSTRDHHMTKGACGPPPEIPPGVVQAPRRGPTHTSRRAACLRTRGAGVAGSPRR
jgi:hypothetical protein